VPKAYVVFTERVIDPERYAEYMAQALEPSVKHGAKPLAITDNPELLEGEWHGPRTIIVEFESLAAAQAWYHSPEYQAVILLRQGALEANGVIVEGRD
jgi:uncharacterized protein (DUF1330 family)